MTKETGGYAFPQHTLEPNPNGGEPRIIWQEGMTLRDYFAAKAMQGLIRFEDQAKRIGSHNLGDFDVRVAVAAYRYADAMLKEREQNV